MIAKNQKIKPTFLVLINYSSAPIARRHLKKKRIMPVARKNLKVKIMTKCPLAGTMRQRNVVLAKVAKIDMENANSSTP